MEKVRGVGELARAPPIDQRIIFFKYQLVRRRFLGR